MKTNNLRKILVVVILMTSNFALAQTQLFMDDFSAQPLDVTNKWRRGDNSASSVSIVNGLLQLNLIDGEAAWVVTQDAFPLSNTTITVKILKATKDGNIGICPSYPKPGNELGIYSEASWYRFYVGRDNISDPDAAPYKLYAYKKKQGVLFNPSTITLPSPFGNEGSPFYMRLRFANSQIYFEYSTDNGSTWPAMHQEAFDLPGYSFSNAFHAEIAATDNSQNNGTLKVDDFQVVSSNATPMIARIILDDPLNSATFVNRKDDSGIDPGFKVKRWNEGSNMDFTAAGWKSNPASPAGDGDLVHYDLRRYIEKGMLEVDVTQFQPFYQNSTDPDIQRHHVLAMFRMPWGGHHVVENLETIWDLHTGSDPQMGNGIKFYAHSYDYRDEDQHFVTNGTSPWDKAQSYHLTIFWEANQIKYLRDGVPLVIHPITNDFNNEMQLRYAYVGRDRTVCSGVYITDFMHNQYPTMRDADGPIYSNLVIKELLSAGDVTPPNITVSVDDEEFANGARVFWHRNEPNVVFYVEYGTTSGMLNSKTTVLDPPSGTTGECSTLLTNLTPNTTYYFRVVGIDNAGNVGTSMQHAFTTLQDGLYIFQPVADTYIEDNNTNAPWLYGDTRAYGNYGWMNLMTSLRRDCFLQFNVGAVTRPIEKVTLRLHGRQSGNTGGELKQFTPVSGNSIWENNATWADATSSNPQYVNRTEYKDAPPLVSFASITADQWRVLDASAATRDANNNYYFVLQGMGTPQGTPTLEAKLSCGAFDSKESTNFQPELIIELQPDFTEMPIALPGVEDGDAAWADYDRDQYLDIVITGLGASGALSKIFHNDKNGNFDEIAANLLPVSSSAVDWGDYDRDNDPDLVLAGDSAGVLATKIYRNDNGNFVALIRPITGVKYGDVAWGNYDHDQYLDLLVSGQSASSPFFFTQLYRGIFNAGIRTWTPAPSITLPQLKYSSVAWGDNSLDGYVDLLLAGMDETNAPIIRIFRNIKNPDGTRGFTIGPYYPPQEMTASLAWSNFDMDTDLDIAFAGRSDATTGVYKRLTDGTYEAVDDASLTDVQQGTVAWGDYDNDSDLDLLLTGQLSNGTARISKVYRNDLLPNGTRKFVDIAAPLAGVYYGSTAWGDYDNDGDLDILLTGNMNASGSAGRITKIYRNNLNIPNTVPSVPYNLSHSYSSTDNTYTLTWNKSADNQTSQNALTYNVMIGTTLLGTDILSPVSHKATGKRFIPAAGNAGTRSYYILNAAALVNGTKYYWKVQAIDNVFAGSAFSSPDSFIAGAAKTAAVADADSVAQAQQAIPQEFALSQNYPNPFNPSTRLNLNLPENGRVVAIVYNLTGQEVVRLQDAEMAAGYKFLDWDGRNAAGTVAGNGVYFVRVIFEGKLGLRKEATSRVLLLK